MVKKIITSLRSKCLFILDHLNLFQENAHFSISEALIAAIEQMKWNHLISPKDKQADDEEDSDEEIKELRQRIRIRKRERLKEVR